MYVCKIPLNIKNFYSVQETRINVINSGLIKIEKKSKKKELIVFHVPINNELNTIIVGKPT